MARRVSIGQSGMSPFVVSMGGYDAIGSNFQRQIFNADQSPFRLLSRNLISDVPPPEIGDGLNDKSVSVGGFPGGKYPVVLVAGRKQAYQGNGGPVAATDISPPYVDIQGGSSYRGDGYGLVVQTNGTLIGLNANEKFYIYPPGGQIYVNQPPITIYYAIMQNMG
jgi:hypothetical protein